FIYKNFLHLNDDTIDAIRNGQIQDKIFQAKLLAIEGAAGQAGSMGGIGAGLGGLGSGMGGSFGGSTFGGGVGGSLGGMGGGTFDAGAGMGAMPTEGIRPHFGKDLSRNSDGDTRNAQ